MSQIPTSRLSRKSIVDRALRRAGNQALGSGPTFEAQIWLNYILYTLYTEYTWPFLRTSTTINLSGESFSLPADFLQTYNDSGLVITAQDSTATFKRLNETDEERFLQMRGTGTLTGMPSWWTANRKTGIASVTPTPNQVAYTAVLHYQFLPAEIPIDASHDSDIPEFPYSEYLIQALYVDALAYESDGRTDTETLKREQMLARIINRANPLRSQPNTIPLDPSVFGTPFRGDIIP